MVSNYNTKFNEWISVNEKVFKFLSIFSVIIVFLFHLLTWYSSFKSEIAIVSMVNIFGILVQAAILTLVFNKKITLITKNIILGIMTLDAVSAIAYLYGLTGIMVLVLILTMFSATKYVFSTDDMKKRIKYRNYLLCNIVLLICLAIYNFMK